MQGVSVAPWLILFDFMIDEPGYIIHHDPARFCILSLVEIHEKLGVLPTLGVICWIARKNNGKLIYIFTMKLAF